MTGSVSRLVERPDPGCNRTAQRHTICHTTSSAPLLKADDFAILPLG
jgi:hypothetical protein